MYLWHIDILQYILKFINCKWWAFFRACIRKKSVS